MTYIAETSTPEEAAALLVALIDTALMNGEITQAPERNLALQCLEELRSVDASTALESRSAIVSKLRTLCFHLAVRTEDTAFQTLSPHRMAALTALLVS
ncbi:hypothetical protein PV768_13855 [Pseudarthrobacter sp. CC4]|nr:hypothetical protein [Pseudarthrobacter sp. GA104]